MCGGGTQTTQQSVQIPPEVLARYNDVNTQAQNVANTPFKQYSTDPSAFVAPLSATQTAGVAGTNAAAGQAQPYFDAATSQLLASTNAGLGFLPGAAADIASGQAYGGAGASQALHSLQQANQSAAPLQSSAAGLYGQGLAGAQPYNAAATSQLYSGLAGAQPLLTSANQNISGAQSGAQPYQALATGLGLGAAQSVDPGQIGSQQINQFLSPYLGTVLNSTQALLDRQNQEQQSGQLGNAIRSGAFGGDRAGIAAASLARQQGLANASIYSGILNQGYGQALGAAQQQQGVQLGAGQANRAALAAASGNLAAIGQQGFGQGITTAQQQAALGQQQFGQGLGAAQGLQGIGNQLYSQNLGTGQAQAQLGNQVFSQGATTAQQQQQIGNELFQQQLAAAQAQQGLGQAAYGIGSGSAQALAGLGQGAQAAGLQGAQAQLAAGQVQQQTAQAGQTALYNQFLQAQSYPFQVAQFLANIAEGTGALSGSTTTTTQPGGFFSDKRLKDDIEPIGKTFDGQDIYSFRYKGDARKQIGLLAQDVEKTHPDAVGLAGGFKTVDYGKATGASAARGKFADGGVAGLDPEVMRQILSNGNGTYGPYVTTLGGMYGGLGRVPAANLPVGQLKIAGPAPTLRSPMESAKDFADLTSTAEHGFDDAKRAEGWISRKFGHSDDPPYARGGLAGYAEGGMPYSGSGLDIPDDKPQLNKLPTPGQPPKIDSGTGDAKDAAEAALAVAKIIAMFKRGGTVRGGYADGGSPDDLGQMEDELSRRDASLERVQPPLDPKAFFRDFVAPHEGGLNPHDLNGSPTFMGFNQRSNPDLDVTKLTPETAAQRFVDKYYTPSGADRMAPGLAAAYSDTYFMNPTRARRILATSDGDPEKFMASRDAWLAHNAAANPNAAKYGPIWAKRDRDLSAYSAGLKPPSAPETAQIAAPPPAEAQTGLAGAEPVRAANDGVANDSGASAPKKDFLHTLLERQNLIPILDFIGAMGTAKTVHPGVALAAGLSGAAQGLKGQQELAIQQQLADAEAFNKTQGAFNTRFISLGSGRFRDSVRGDIIDNAERTRRLMSVPAVAKVLGTSLTPPNASATSTEAPATPGAAPAVVTPPVSATAAAPTKTEPPTGTEAIYGKYDTDPRVKSLRDQADRFASDADHLLAQANDPYVKGTPVAEQLIQQATSAREQAHQYIEQWQNLREKYAAPEIATLTEAQKARFGVQNEVKTETFTQARQAQDTLNQIHALRSQIVDPKTGKINVSGGPATGFLSKVGALLMQTPFVNGELAKQITGTDPNNAAAVAKLQTTLGTEIARQELQGSPVRQNEWQQFLKSTPGIDMPTAAALFVLDKMIAPRAQGSVDLYKRVEKMDPLQEDVRSSVFDYWNEHPWFKPPTGPAGETGAASPTKPPEIPRNAQGLLMPRSAADMQGQPPGTRFIIPSGQKKGQPGTWK